jgi:hypothetical protein
MGVYSQWNLTAVQFRERFEFSSEKSKELFALFNGKSKSSTSSTAIIIKVYMFSITFSSFIHADKTPC